MIMKGTLLLLALLIVALFVSFIGFGLIARWASQIVKLPYKAYLFVINAYFDYKTKQEKLKQEILKTEKLEEEALNEAIWTPLNKNKEKE